MDRTTVQCWQAAAARRRTAEARAGVTVPRIAIFSITDKCNVRQTGRYILPGIDRLPSFPAPYTYLMKNYEPSVDAHEAVREAASLIRSARYLTAFTGAGISVESGIPPFRGPGGLWGKYDPRTLELDYFLANPACAWPVIKEIFYDHFGTAKPNTAHFALARLETAGRLKVLITQNIDNLHYVAGNRNIVEFHGNSRMLRCLSCGKTVEASAAILEALPPHCACGGIYKPDFIFFGEGIPPEAHARAERAASRSDVMLVVGSTGEVYPAALVPRWAAEAGAKVIEINPEASAFTDSVTDILIPLEAGEAFELLMKASTP